MPAKKGSAIARKTAARLAAVQVLYQMRLNDQDARTALKDFAQDRVGKDMDGDTYVTPDDDVLETIVEGVESRWMDIDTIVSAALKEGGRTQVEDVLDCILRAGVYELLTEGSIDTAVIINDYLNVSAGFYEGKETGLVNGILDKVAKTVRG